METIYNELRTRIQEHPSIRTVDVYNGQLRDEENNYVALYPAVFLSFEDIEFEYGSDTFTGVLRVRIATSDLVHSQTGIFRLSKAIDALLHDFKPVDTSEPLTRKGMNPDTDSTGVYVMERTYILRGQERTGDEIKKTVTVRPDIVVTH